MKDHHLQLNLAKTELLVVSANPSFITISSTITPSTARNLGVVIDDQLNFTDHITKNCPVLVDLHYIILRRSGPFSRSMQHKLLVQALVLSRLELLQCSLGRSSSQFHQTSTINPEHSAARLIFNEPKRTHVTPLFINLPWLPIAAQCIKFKALMFAYRTHLWLCTLYLNSLLQTYMPSRSLVNDA